MPEDIDNAAGKGPDLDDIREPFEGLYQGVAARCNRLSSRCPSCGDEFLEPHPCFVRNETTSSGRDDRFVVTELEVAAPKGGLQGRPRGRNPEGVRRDEAME